MYREGERGREELIMYREGERGREELIMYREGERGREELIMHRGRGGLMTWTGKRGEEEGDREEP